MKKILTVVLLLLIMLVNENCKKMTDQESKSLKTVKIGSQVWSVENLNVEHYRNGDVIPQVQDRDKWSKLTTGAWCYYDNNSEIGRKHGKLYNWYAIIDERGLAPQGWHIPKKIEFETLVSIVNGNGYSLTSKGVSTGDSIGANKSGFSALLAGYRSSKGDFSNIGNTTNFWSSTISNDMVAYSLGLANADSNIYLTKLGKANGFSVRIVEDY